MTDQGVIRTQAERPGVEVELIDSRASIAGIGFDRQGFLWSVSTSPGASILVTSASGEPSFVQAAWLAGQSIQGFALSPEGSRVALLVQGANRTQVFISGVVRGISGLPLELADPIEVANEQTNPISVAWVDQVSIVSVNAEGESRSGLLTTIGGTARSIPAVTGTKAILAAGSGSQLYLLTEAGQLFTYRGSTWSPLREAIRTVAVFD